MARPNYESDLKNIRYPVSKSLIPLYKNFNCGDGWDRVVVVSYPYMGIDKYKKTLPYVFNSDDILDDLGRMIDGLDDISAVITDSSNRLNSWKGSISSSASSVAADVISRSKKYYDLAKSIVDYWNSSYDLFVKNKDAFVGASNYYKSSLSWGLNDDEHSLMRICREIHSDHSTEELKQLFGSDFKENWWDGEVSIHDVLSPWPLHPRFNSKYNAIFIDDKNGNASNEIGFSCDDYEKILEYRNADANAFKKFFLAALLNARCAQEYVTANYIYERNKAAYVPPKKAYLAPKKATVILPQEEIPVPGIETAPLIEPEKKSSLPLLLGAAALIFVLGKKK